MKRMNNVVKFVATLLTLSLLLYFNAHTQDQQSPNILLIMADDLGYSDLGSYGGEIRTPNLDQLAENGLRYTQMYTYSRCSPSRAALLTGLYPHQAGIGFFAGNRPQNPHGYRGHLQDNAVTLAEILKTFGYRTFMTGKWHVSDPEPTQQGFEEFYGFTHGYGIDSWDPGMNIRLPEGRPEIEYEEGEYFATDVYTDYALEFIEQSIQESPDQPWFTFVSYQAPHFPLQAPEQYINKYTEKYRAGWDKLRDERLERMKRIGVLSEEVELSPRSLIPRPDLAEMNGVPGNLEVNPAWSDIPDERQKDLVRRMAVYAGMVDNMDYNIGRIIRYLRDQRQMHNTVILFVSDNGACAEWDPYGFDLTPEILAATEKGVGIRAGTPGLPSKLYEGDELDKMGGPGTGIAYGSGWANLSNTPLSEYKHYSYEGGIAVPFIMHWPDGINAEENGLIRRQPSFMSDITATIIDVAGATYPDEFDGRQITPLEGRSLLPVVDGKVLGPRPLVFEHSGNVAIRDGKWKLVGNSVLDNRGIVEDPQWRLYNIDKDRSEIYDLSMNHPGVIERLKQLFVEEANRTNILPRPGQR